MQEVKDGFVFIKVTAGENQCHISILRRSTDEFTFEDIKDEINAEFCELVTLQDPLKHLSGLCHSHLMAVCDDSAKLKHKPFNPVASLFYAPWQDYIAGDCLLCWDFPAALTEEQDAFAFPEIVADQLIKEMRPLFTENVIFDI